MRSERLRQARGASRNWGRPPEVPGEPSLGNPRGSEVTRPVVRPHCHVPFDGFPVAEPEVGDRIAELLNTFRGLQRLMHRCGFADGRDLERWREHLAVKKQRVAETAY